MIVTIFQTVKKLRWKTYRQSLRDTGNKNASPKLTDYGFD